MLPLALLHSFTLSLYLFVSLCLAIASAYPPVRETDADAATTSKSKFAAAN